MDSIYGSEINNYEIIQMDYANAVKRPKTRGFILDAVRSQANTEFGTEFSQDIVKDLQHKFGLDYLYTAVEKVFIYLFELI